MTTQIKSMLKKTMAIGLVAGAVALTGTVKAEAQQWAVGVQFGAPVYGYAPAYGPDYYARNRYERERQDPKLNEMCREADQQNDGPGGASSGAALQES